MQQFAYNSIAGKDVDVSFSAIFYQAFNISRCRNLVVWIAHGNKYLQLYPEILSPSGFPPSPTLVFGQHCLVDGEYAKALHPEVV